MKPLQIGLVDVDSLHKARHHGSSSFPNLALMKIARYWREIGGVVEWAMPFKRYDKIYMSKVFNFTPDDHTAYMAREIIKGGTGYDIASALPDEIDRLQPDYSIYPRIPKDAAYGFLTRGCPNRCPWCVVPRKEGVLRPYMDIEEIAIDGRSKITLMDNNILAAGDYAKEQLEKIIANGYSVDFNQALDARLVTDEFARLLASTKWLNRRIRFGCDTSAQIETCEKAIAMINSHGFKGEYFLYTMIGGKQRSGEDWEQSQRRLLSEAYGRINHWWIIMREQRRNHYKNAVYAFAQPYRDPDNPNAEIPQWQKDMAQWCNKRQLFTIIPFSEFSPRKNFLCQRHIDEYLT